MIKPRIKGAHIPRLILAVVAILLFFATLLLEWTNEKVDFTQPGWGYVMLGFLLVGIGMLLVSWKIGFDTWGEFAITLVMIALHIIFDTYMLIYVRFLGNPIPIPIIQLVIQGYWLAGLLDVIAMFWVDNVDRLAKAQAEEQPETKLLKENDTLKQGWELLKSEHAKLQQDHAVLQANHTNVIENQRGASEDAQRVLLREIERGDSLQARIDQMVTDANRVYVALCDECGKSYEGTTQASADAKRDGHLKKHGPKLQPVN